MRGITQEFLKIMTHDAHPPAFAKKHNGPPLWYLSKNDQFYKVSLKNDQKFTFFAKKQSSFSPKIVNFLRKSWRIHLENHDASDRIIRPPCKCMNGISVLIPFPKLAHGGSKKIDELKVLIILTCIHLFCRHFFPHFPPPWELIDPIPNIN